MRFRFISAVVGGAALAAALAFGAESGVAQEAQAQVDLRIKTMKQLGGHMQAISKVAKGEAPYSPQTATEAAGVADIAHKVPDLFPAGSVTDKSRAKPEIWMKWDDFKQAAARLETEADKLAMVSKDGDAKAIGMQLAAVGKTCGGCHDSFRKPQEQ